jgi:hypothetical protein
MFLFFMLNFQGSEELMAEQLVEIQKSEEFVYIR